MHAARPEIIRVHAAAGCWLLDHHELFARFDPPQRWRERADIHGLGRDIEKVRQQAADFVIEHANDLRALWHGNSKQALDGETEGVLLAHRRYIIEAIEIGHRLQI